ncbi:MAG: hypothetical protein ACD_4C00378G0002 [uncultured bacterium (gcode 4)]|uniref:Uncharacterized protein n=1 Tax=uncultured bacterium (gcode 4) TaxID=1234023 RepID=K2F567_9BACT|nr:MAG: hypothetical protein ACD_4C00378G0002 [uncultured bacterium (gcode 4)]
MDKLIQSTQSIDDKSFLFLLKEQTKRSVRHALWSIFHPIESLKELVKIENDNKDS